jgi:hypothetical protein
MREREVGHHDPPFGAAEMKTNGMGNLRGQVNLDYPHCRLANSLQASRQLIAIRSPSTVHELNNGGKELIWQTIRTVGRFLKWRGFRQL